MDLEQMMQDLVRQGFVSQPHPDSFAPDPTRYVHYPTTTVYSLHDLSTTCGVGNAQLGTGAQRDNADLTH